MPKPTKPASLYTVNGFWLELPGLINPHFETVEGITKGGGTINTVDAGSNKRLSFSDQIEDFGEMTITRPKQGTPDDATLEAMLDACVRQGLKMPMIMVKVHNQQEVYRILFEGFRLVRQNYPNHDINSGDKFVVSYTCTCDDWKYLP